MNERHFTVTDGLHALACGMTFEMAITFIIGYYKRYYNEKLLLEIVEEDDEVQDGTD